METDRLANLIEQKLQVLDGLWQLTQRQRDLVDDRDLTRLLRLLSAKQKLLTRLQAVERALDAYRDQDPEQRVWRSSEVREAARVAAATCEQRLADLMRVEQECESHMVKRRDETAHRLHDAHDASQARAAYLQASHPQAHQIDLSSDT